MTKKKIEAVVEETKDTVTNVYQAIVDAVSALKVDVEKLCEKDNMAAGRRARQTAQELKAKAQLLRLIISEKVNEIKG